MRNVTNGTRADVRRGIGIAEVDRVNEEVMRALLPKVQERFEPNEGVYRLGDWCGYAPSSAVEDYFDARPAWEFDCWILTDNGQYSPEQVAEMTVEQMAAARADDGFEPEYAFYTTADEDGFV